MAHRRHHYQNIIGSQEPTIDKSKFPITKEEASRYLRVHLPQK